LEQLNAEVDMDDGDVVGAEGEQHASTAAHPSCKQMPGGGKLHPSVSFWRPLRVNSHPKGCCCTLTHPLHLPRATQAMCCSREGTSVRKGQSCCSLSQMASSCSRLAPVPWHCFWFLLASRTPQAHVNGSQNAAALHRDDKTPTDVW